MILINFIYLLTHIYKGGYMAKFYAVAKGKSGEGLILNSWEDCKKEVMGVKGAIYKSFASKEEAKEFLNLHNNGKTDSNEEDLNSDMLYIYVDGSFMEARGNYSFGLVAVKNGEVLHKDKGIGHEEHNRALRNVAGEVLGAMKAVEYALNNDYKEVTICFDYQGIESWALGTWQRNRELTKHYHHYMKEKMKKLKIYFKKIKGHSGDKYNDLADKLAKSALE